MAGVYTEETLQPLNKTQFIKLFLKTQEQTNNTVKTLTEEINEIHCSFKKLESEIIVIKKVNDALVKQLSCVERQCWKNAQYSRRECLEVMGIPPSVEHDQLEPTACRILHYIDVNISGDKIEACHRLGKKSDRTIVKFSSRKDCEHTMRVKKDLKDLDATDLDLPAGTKLYINDSLCPYYRGLWNETKKLWNKKKMFSYFTVSGIVRIRLQEKGPYSIITHVDDLKELLPDEDFSMF